ncbi:HEAT repeat domain-containing protein [Gordonia alkaliphila]|uniref:HEAT repeat domain-containing protein n=1 Tax=Gordonia alkaliphila TaxID=1053547 RepID=UPI001FF689DC|nr:HEAT repeat domain-containing protein [Gordonia alkaliphila]MCK0440798.1 HEAT repeat domain-containing protein [Gordonia alkaliphila]
MTVSMRHEQVSTALTAPNASVRLRAALAAGTEPAARYPALLVQRCAIERDFFVRDMLTWALVRQDVEATLPLLLREVRGRGSQAKSQALHTMSKIGDPRGWSAVTPELLDSPDDDLAASAWRAAVVLVPDDLRESLAWSLAARLGRDDRPLRRSLSRALAALGQAAESPLRAAASSDNEAVRVHAAATQRLLDDPDAGLDEV